MSVSFSDANENNFPGGTDLDSSLSSVLNGLASGGSAGDPLTNYDFGEFHGGSSYLDGTSYSFSSTGNGLSFEATGDLHYYNVEAGSPAVTGATDNTIYGELDSITIGKGGLDSNGHVESPALTITFNQPLETTLAEGHSGAVYDVIWGLMNGSANGATDSGTAPSSEGGLIAELSHLGVNVNESVADLVGTAQTAAVSHMALAA